MPPEEDDATFSAGVWLEYAEEDLGAARSLVPLGYLRSACFHAQQAAERALKGLLAFLSEEEISRTHDLNLLVRLVAERGGGRSQPPGCRNSRAMPSWPAIPRRTNPLLKMRNER